MNTSNTCLTLFFSAVTAALILSCGNNVEPTQTQRWVYYPVSTKFNSPADKAGMYRTSLVTGTTERLTTASVSVVTSVAKNGVVLFEYDDSLRQRIWGRCEDGRLIPVPFPENEDPAYQYKYLWPTAVTLSLEGHRAAYTVVYEPVAAGEPEKIIHRIAYFDCAKWEMTVVDFQDFVRQQMSSVGVTVGRVYGQIFFTDETGDGILFEVTGLKWENNVLTEVGRLIVQWDKTTGAFSAVMPPNTAGPQSEGYTTLYVFQLSSQTMLLRRQEGGGTKLTGRSLKSPATVTLPISGGTSISRHQIAHLRDEMAYWGVNGIELRRVSDGTVLSYPVLYSDVDRTFGSQQFSQIRNLSVSPDGEWIIFGAVPTAQPNRTGVDLFAARRDGSGLKRIAEDVHTYEPAASMGVPR